MRRLLLVVAALGALHCSSGSKDDSPGSGGKGGAGSCGSNETPAAGLAITDRGAVQGFESGDTWGFEGIPYAAPPVGDLRWKPPSEAACFDGTFQAKLFGPECAQLDDQGALTGSEDCLTLNVWTPKSATPGATLPVLFFMPGGGNVSGGSSQAAKDGTFIYDGANLASETNAVVVTINYRLNVFGWFAHGELDSESPNHASGNYGALDQIAALQWVQRNAKAFGGDPAHVLLFGESAGGEDVCTLIASPLASGLFSAAVMESGGCFAYSHDDVVSFGDTVVSASGCSSAPDVLACMRAVPTDAMAKAVPGVTDLAGAQNSYQENVDGYVLTDTPRNTLRAGKHNHVPWIVGTNAKETNIAVPQMTNAQYLAKVNAQFGALAPMVLDEYPIQEYGTGRDAYVALTTDLKFVCGARNSLRAAAEGQSEPLYRYVFSHVLEDGSAQVKALGPYHGFELLFVFDHLGVSGYTPTAGDTGVAKSIGSYWRNLGAKGDPNDGTVVGWARYDATTDNYQDLDDPMSPKEGVRTEQCDFWLDLFPDQ